MRLEKDYHDLSFGRDYLFGVPDEVVLPVGTQSSETGQAIIPIAGGVALLAGGAALFLTGHGEVVLGPLRFLAQNFVEHPREMIPAAGVVVGFIGGLAGYSEKKIQAGLDWALIAGLACWSVMHMSDFSQMPWNTVSGSITGAVGVETLSNVLHGRHPGIFSMGGLGRKVAFGLGAGFLGLGAELSGGVDSNARAWMVTGIATAAAFGLKETIFQSSE